MKLIIIVSFALIFSCCNNKTSNKKIVFTDTFVVKGNSKPELQSVLTDSSPALTKPVKTIFKWNHYEFDTVLTMINMADTNQVLGKWSDYEKYFSVYRISKKLTGIALDVNDPFNPFSNLISKYVNFSTDKYADSSGGMNLQYSPKLQQAIFKKDTTKEFYIYCMKGRTVAKVENVYYEKNEDECSVNIVFSLSEIDTATFGTPLIASKKMLDLTYGKFEKFEHDLKKYDAYWNTIIDFPDRFGSKVFAFNDDFVLTYKDNFLWYKTGSGWIDDGLSYPGRAVFKVIGKKVESIGGSNLDLLGVPCI